MKTINVTVQAEIIVQFDEKSEEFKELWQDYKAYFHEHADYESFAKHIAHTIAKYGTTELIEGVGYVKLNGKNQKFFHEGEYKEAIGLVNVEVDTDINSMVDFDFYDTEDLSEDNNE